MVSAAKTARGVVQVVVHFQGYREHSPNPSFVRLDGSSDVILDDVIDLSPEIRSINLFE
jgi:hypothetical protein